MDRREFLGRALGLTVVSTVTPAILTCACEAFAKQEPLAFGPIVVDLTLSKYAALKNVEGSAYVAIPGNTKGIILNRASDTEFVALSSACSHKESLVRLYNATTSVMPCSADDHGPSKYDIFGEVVQGPATKPLVRYTVAYDATAQTVTITDQLMDVAAKTLSTGGIETIHPNPFSNKTTIEVSMPEHAGAELAIFDISGNKLATVFDGSLDSGAHSFTLDGSGLAAGTYFCKLTTAKASVVRQIQIVR
jgi:hypothetical protein